MKTEIYPLLCRRLTFSLLSWLSLIVCCWYGSATAPLFAQQNTFLPLSKNTIWLYSHTVVEQGWQNVNTNDGSLKYHDYSSRKTGYFYSKVLGDTLLRGIFIPYALVFQSPRYVDTQELTGLGGRTTIQYSTKDAYYQYDDSQSRFISVFSASTKYYTPFSMYPKHSVSSDSNNYTFSFSMVRRGYESGSSSGKSATISRGKGLTCLSEFFSGVGGAGKRSRNQEIKLIGMIVDGKIYGDSLIRFLNTETNQFIGFKVSAPREITATVNEILEIPITFSPPKNTTLIGQSLTVNLSFNASVLEPIEDTPRGNVVAGMRTIPINLQIMRTDSDTVKKLKFRCAIGNDTATILRLDSLKFSTPQPVLIDLQSGSMKVSGNNLAGGSPQRFFSKGKNIIVSAYPNPFNNVLNVSLSGETKFANMKLTLFNVHGMEISSVAKSALDGAGQQSIEFAVPDTIPSGVYVL
ncbi:MAG: hypothetical protein JNN25_07145, partial [Candidatus Kapabacteria bacterium]|nr:hypothetical protein [Candidatus Kapabacteria bacterium]